MKIYLVIFLFLLIIEISFITSSDCNFGDTASKAKDCEDKDLEEGSEYKHCCYIKGKYNSGESVSSCVPLKESEYNDIDKTIKDYEENSKSKIDKLDCKSFYLQFGLISLVFLIF